MISGVASGVGDSACVAVGAEVGLSSDASLGAGVSVRIGVLAGARVSGRGVGSEQAIRAARMTAKGVGRNFSTWNPPVLGGGCHSGLMIARTPLLSAQGPATFWMFRQGLLLLPPHLHFPWRMPILVGGDSPTRLGWVSKKDVIIIGDVRDAWSGTRAATVGGILGIVPAVALGLLGFALSEEPEAFPQLPGHIASTLVYLVPYVLVLIAGAAPNPGVRGGLLLALGLLSLAASFSAFSLVTLAFLPATVVIWFAAVRSLADARPLLVTALTGVVGGLLIAAMVGFSFYSLLLAQEGEPRCWTHTRGPDGHSRWESKPEPQSPGVLSVSSSGGTRSFCTSDIITNGEAATSITVLAAAFLVMLSVARFHRAARERPEKLYLPP